MGKTFEREFNSMNTEELRQKITDGSISFADSSTVIQQGELAPQLTYEIKHGWQISYANDCDLTWTAFYAHLFEYLAKQKLSTERINEILSSLSAQDKHWDWYQKAITCKSDEYEWFFLIAEGNPQGVCIIYHPRPSKLTDGNIFYLEYLAVAPWNRDSLIVKKKFKGVGTKLLKCAMNYATETLKLQPGFSLHSLEQAESYYLKIGMTHLSSEDKPKLKYFEMATNVAQQMVSK